MFLKNVIQRKNTDKGFTLTELMIVVAIIGILGLVATPALITMRSSSQVRSAAQDISSAFHKARSMAIKSRRPVVLEFNTAENFYTLDGKRYPAKGSLSYHYGSGICFGAITFGTSITFTAQGLPNNVGFVSLHNDKAEGYRVGIQGLAGNIIMQKE